MITGTAGYGGFPLEVEMRATPSLHIENFTYLDWTLDEHVEPKSIGKNGSYTNSKSVVLQMEKAQNSTLAKGNVVMGTAEIVLSAEIE